MTSRRLRPLLALVVLLGTSAVSGSQTTGSALPVAPAALRADSILRGK